MNHKRIVLTFGILYGVLFIAGMTALYAENSNSSQRSPKIEQSAAPTTSQNTTGWVRSIDTSNSVGMLVIALTVAYIAYQQYVVNRDKLRSDLFDKRYSVYDSCRQFLTTIHTHGDVTLDNIEQFRFTSSQTVFLFPNRKIDHLCTEMRKNARLLMKGNAILNQETPQPTDEDFAKAKTEILNIKQWFSDQDTRLVDLFDPHCKFRK